LWHSMESKFLILKKEKFFQKIKKNDGGRMMISGIIVMLKTKDLQIYIYILI
jgi:hypothetical protein